MKVIQHKYGKWNLCPFKVRYTNTLNVDEYDISKWANPSKRWWEELSELHEHIEIHAFIEVEVTEVMENRFKEIEYMPDDIFEVYLEYVLTGNTSNDVELPLNHPFNILKLQKKQGEQIDYLVDIDFRLSMTELGL